MSGIEMLAYVGPGLGAGTLALLIGFAGSIMLALFAVIWYPVRRAMRAVRSSFAGNQSTTVLRSGGVSERKTVETVEQ
ncbi:hypothetical protein [Blastopirellula marina]|uniref:Uncharacterized protein n=1 Tax=Blastopirellula marina TaxID=124 RepID=A0A2S8GF93_9BACT|nr:hypothetical protein [Blastopirellula marina]PQO42911.1 hypothetical protein C5Y93_24615 [Blastopirellula marina]